MHYKAGNIEITSDVRSVPLGAKRRKGRPKNIPNCLIKSPVQALPQNVDDPIEEDMEEIIDLEEEIVDVGVKTRKRKQPGLQNQKPPKKRPRLPAGLEKEVVDSGQTKKKKPATKRPRLPSPAPVPSATSKPSAKRPRLPAAGPPSASLAPTCVPSASPSPTSGTATSTSAAPKKPIAKKCKKKAGTCSHEIVFGTHYDRNEWNIFAEHVRSAKSLTVIDPDYAA
jgi:hypothetical protein